MAMWPCAFLVVTFCVMKVAAATALLASVSVAQASILSLGRQSLEEFRGHGVRLPPAPESVLRGFRAVERGDGVTVDEYGDTYYNQAIVDHQKPSEGTWSQRFFVNDTNWDGQGPIMLYIGGEGPLSASAVSAFSFMSNLAEEHHALVVALEHRFYGKVRAHCVAACAPPWSRSTARPPPFPLLFFFHTVPLPALTHHGPLRSRTRPRTCPTPICAFSPTTRPSATLPASKPGSRASTRRAAASGSPSAAPTRAASPPGASPPAASLHPFLTRLLFTRTRNRFPDQFVGSVASSAPVRAVENMWQYMVRSCLAPRASPARALTAVPRPLQAVVGRSLHYFGGRQCVDAMANASYSIHQLGATTEGRAQLHQHFNTCSTIGSDADLSVFESEVMGAVQGLVQYNEFQRGKGHVSPVALLCQTVTSAPTPLEGMARVMLGKRGGCVDASFADSIAFLSKTEFDGHSSARQWYYQTCRTFGFYQTTDYENQPFYWFRGVDLDSFTKVRPPCVPAPVATPLRDPSLSPLQVCQQVFGIAGPNTTVVDTEFKADHPDNTNTVFVNGNIDPWHSLSVFTNSTIIAHPTSTAVFINGTAHCGDMYRASSNDIPSLKVAHGVIRDHVRTWLA